MPAATPRRRRTVAGFTLIELVMVLVIVGALSVVALPKLLDLTAWRARAFADELVAQSMAMQRLALTQRRPVLATITPAGVSFAYVAGGALASVDCPATATPCIAEAGTRSVTFNAANSGRVATSTGSALPVTVSAGGTTLAYVIEAETGLIHSAP